MHPSTVAPSKSSTPANDSFSNLVSFTSSTSNKNLSLQEQHQIREEQKAKQEAERQKLFDAHFGSQHSQSQSTLDNGRAIPDRVNSPIRAESFGVQTLSNVINKPFAGIGSTGPAPSPKPTDDDDDDVLAAFNSTAPVDTSSNFPAPSESSEPRETRAGNTASTLKPIFSSSSHDLAGHNWKGVSIAEDEDDPFGLGQMTGATPSLPSAQADGTDEDDVLGLLGKPISELPQPKGENPSIPPVDRTDVAVSSADVYPQDQAIAELVDMGFPAAKAKEALARTQSGTDIQAAVGWLLSQAHEESRQKGRGRASPNVMRRQHSDKSETLNGDKLVHTHDPRDDAALPAWMRTQSRSNSTQRRQDSRSPANGDKDAAQYAAEISSNLFKSANSLWKTSTKKMQQAVADLNSDSDSNQPKWMRSGHAEGEAPRSKVRRPSLPPDTEMDRGGPRSGLPHPRPENTSQHNNITDEALMLESGNSRPATKTWKKTREPNPRLPPSSTSSRDQSPAPNNGFDNLKSTHLKVSQPQQRYGDDPKTRISRQAVEEQSSAAYVSPARRKRPTPRPAVTEPDLLLDSRAASRPSRPSTTGPKIPQHTATRTPSSATSSEPLKSIPTRPKPPPRKMPAVSPGDLQSSTTYRQQGTQAFKLGDYAAAHLAYTSALTPLPDQHPITIIILCNRALTGLKTGEPKAAASDADTALSLIGPSRGEGETIVLGNHEGQKEMREFYGKALMRKAEALEQMERWTEAASVWREAVETGHGGSTSIQGRNRTEKAAGRASSQTSAPATRKPPPAKKPPPPKKQSALDQLSAHPTPSAPHSAEAVTRLRAANAAAEKADDEKFALADSVDAKLTAWKNGKQDNLRALLGSLDTVLWPEAGWKKVGLHELVLANKVKVVYMRGIAKVHPDKVGSPSQFLFYFFGYVCHWCLWLAFLGGGVEADAVGDSGYSYRRQRRRSKR